MRARCDSTGSDRIPRLARELSLEHVGVALEQALTVLKQPQENLGILHSGTARTSQVVGSCVLPGEKPFASRNVIFGKFQFLQMKSAQCLDHGGALLLPVSAGGTANRSLSHRRPRAEPQRGDNGQRCRSDAVPKNRDQARPRTHPLSLRSRDEPAPLVKRSKRMPLRPARRFAASTPAPLI